MKYYYLEKNKTIVCFDSIKDNVINSLPFLKHIADFKVKDIKETEEEIISRYNKNTEQMEIVFLKDVESEVLREEKDSKILHLKEINKDNIYSKYTLETQVDILAGIKPQLNIEDMKSWIGNSLNAYQAVLLKINSCKNVAEIRALNIQEEYDKLIKEE